VESEGLLQELVEGLADTGVQPVVEGTPLAGRIAVPTVVDARTLLTLDFSMLDFENAVTELDDAASSLWPDRLPLHRAVGLMLVHIEGDLSTVAESAARTVLKLRTGGNAHVRAQADA